MEYRTLTPADLTALHSACVAAYSDYIVEIRPTVEQLERLLARNGVRYDFSVGAFENGEMVGFTLNGLDQWEGRATLYDSATGVIPRYRGLGIARQMFEFLLPIIIERQVRQYLLEVITTNEPAVRLYRSLGFRETRLLDVFIVDDSARLSPRRKVEGLRLQEEAKPDWPLFESFWECRPSWQNSINSIKRSQSRKKIITAHMGNRCVGYGVVSPATGDVPQLAVSAEHRRKGIGSTILTALKERVAAGTTLKLNNLDRSAKDLSAFCQARHFRPIVSQYEMTMKL